MCLVRPPSQQQPHTDTPPGARAPFTPALGPRKADFLTPRGSRRRRLWELEARSHCPLVGICFSLVEVRSLVRRAAPALASREDFDLHAAVVHECAERNVLSELLQRELELRYALEVQQRRKLRNVAALTTQWQAALGKGQVAGALWATLTHPVCDATLAARVYGDVHMLQHQLGAGERVERQALERLQQENLALLRELAEAQRRTTQYRDEHAAEMATLRRELADVRSACAGHEAAAARHYGQLLALREAVREPDQRAALTRRCRLAEERCTALRARQREQDLALERAQQQIARLEATLARLLPEDEASAEAPAAAATTLDGQRVLCVGGRSGAASLYRRLVERHGGEFVFHDGGLEESMGRLDASIAAADAVICHAGCISHNAYWRVKEFCKRSGKRCTFLRNPSLSAFLDGLEELGSEPDLTSA